ncbi:MAG: hypothetical protein JO297_12995 [Nitrososphaeraceae archaeon]|nr:hypothetical protein [Nitrososphaeraceae archaeon]
MQYITQNRNRREKYRAVLLVKGCYSVKMGLLRNATVVMMQLRLYPHNNKKKKLKLRVL